MIANVKNIQISWVLQPTFESLKYYYLGTSTLCTGLKYQVIIIGAGIVGLATAHALLRSNPRLRLLLLDKEAQIGMHQTGHNSGVIHSGLYYKPGSLKAINCIEGYRQLLSFCDQQQVPYEICGKIVVATDAHQLPLLASLHQRGIANGLAGLKSLTKEELMEYEPHVRGLQGLWVPQTGIINYREVADALADLIVKQGGTFQMKSNVVDIKVGAHVEVVTQNESYPTQLVISCAGLYSDQVTRFTEPNLDIRIIPFRGEYYKLRSEKEYLVKNLIYPVPDPDFPFLGVHFTRMKNGGIEAGPNAVLAFAKQGYKKTDVNLKEFLDTLRWPGFQKIAIRYLNKGLGELYRSYSKHAFTNALQKLIPEIRASDLFPGGAGVRAQASSRNGGLLDDFHIVENQSGIHVCNAPSPAATSSLSIGKTIADRALARL